MAIEPATIEGWAVLELLGRRRIAGYVREVTVAGAGFLRVDVPGDGHQTPVTQFVSPASLYIMTPCAEAVARAMAAHKRPEPVARWELPRPSVAVSTRAARRQSNYFDPDEDEDDDEDEEG